MAAVGDHTLVTVLNSSVEARRSPLLLAPPATSTEEAPKVAAKEAYRAVLRGPVDVHAPAKQISGLSCA